MEKLPMCIFRYIMTYITIPDKFTLRMVNKKFKQTVEVTMNDFNYMVNNRYKLSYYRLLKFGGTFMMYIYCEHCRSSGIQKKRVCMECNKIYCEKCILQCNICKSNVDVCKKCMGYVKNDKYLVYTCYNCSTMCDGCSYMIYSPYYVYNNSRGDNYCIECFTTI